MSSPVGCSGGGDANGDFSREACSCGSEMKFSEVGFGELRIFELDDDEGNEISGKLVFPVFRAGEAKKDSECPSL
jgi:hypothetical protein